MRTCPDEDFPPVTPARLAVQVLQRELPPPSANALCLGIVLLQRLEHVNDVISGVLRRARGEGILGAEPGGSVPEVGGGEEPACKPKAEMQTPSACVLPIWTTQRWSAPTIKGGQCTARHAVPPGCAACPPTL